MSDDSTSIGYPAFALMLVVAVIIDLTQFLLLWIPFAGPLLIAPILGPIISVGAYFIFWLWFKEYGIDTNGGKDWKWSIAALVFELMPDVGDAVPGWTLYVGRTVIASWFRERTQAEV